ncbi:MAG: alpha/beta hydrolase [Butyrivibrio sp.]|uniref:alpha/beta hydrolase n=1 Tax=Butyrivibrio sp. TaxID=28121 RepID=UPI001B1D2D15|nr:alpha/beta hydrolase-fold protein [Butyrivibrio sp.]MBO6242370.1 alpha/beta hydrolase [Butyrivibrio sp.]
MIVEGKHIYIYGEKGKKVPLVITNTFQGNGSSIYNELCSMTDKKVNLAVISDINWDDEMSPWECPPLSKNDSPCTGGADKYLKKLTDSIIPAIKNDVGTEPEYIGIAGYSLAGLFAIYSLYKTDIFSRAVSASGSMWFPDFVEYTQKNDFSKKPDKVYFSLGDKEAHTRHKLLGTVEDKTHEIYEQFKAKGINAIFEMNPGNHFKDADIRLAKGIAWIL